MEKVLVVIPVYKENLSNFEKISLTQARRVLSRYDICFMAPEEMRPFLTYHNCKSEYWPDECFSSRDGYSALLLTPEFYLRFANYEYILIYQLDAFVFDDKLEEFCNMGYDYIGAPMTYWSGWPYNLNRVGNGGLSLRKVSACIKVTRNREEIYTKTNAKKEMEYDEDRFFAWCGWDKQVNFVTAPSDVALDFAVEYNFKNCYRDIARGQLPFGCHGWSKTMHFDKWERHIRAAGYNLNEEVSVAMRAGGKKARREAYIYGICSTLIRNMEDRKDKNLRTWIAGQFSWLDNAIIWGNGIVGRRAVKFFKFLGLNIYQIYDENVQESASETKEYRVLKPDLNFIKKGEHKVLVTPKKYYDDISSKLKGIGLKENEDFYNYISIERRVASVIAKEKYHGKRFAWL